MTVTIDLKNTITEKKDVFQDSVLSWARCHFRDYPWRHHQQNPYAILVAELLLKRTTATAAANTYPVFFKKYPTLPHLATATEEELIKDLMPVGLYRQRAKAISRMTGYLMKNENGTIPNSLERLLKIPGLGSYSARAILSFGFDFHVAVVDANVVRVVQRIFKKSTQKKSPHFSIQEIMDFILPRENHRKFNFGILDFGAIICRYVLPLCEECKMNTICDSYRIDAETGIKVKQDTILREIRLAKGVGLVQLAKKAGTSKLTIINIEAGRTIPRPETLRKLADAMGVRTKDLERRQK